MLEWIVNCFFLTIYGFANKRAFPSTWHVLFVLTQSQPVSQTPRAPSCQYKEYQRSASTNKRQLKKIFELKRVFPIFCRGFHYLNRFDPNLFFFFFSNIDSHDTLKWFLFKYWDVLSVLSMYWVYFGCIFRVCGISRIMSHLNLQ